MVSENFPIELLNFRPAVEFIFTYWMRKIRLRGIKLLVRGCSKGELTPVARTP
jgi:hypothetical protein